MRCVLCFAIVLLGMPPSVGRGQNAKGRLAGEVFKAGVKIFVGAAAAESMKRAGSSWVDLHNASTNAERGRHDYERVRREQIDGVIRQLRTQGLSGDQDSVYSLFLNIDPNAASVRWADTFSYPDVFFVVDVEGIGQFVLPGIGYEYHGGPIMDRIALPTLRSGTRVVIRILDDDTPGDQIWNTILRTKVNYHFRIGGTALAAMSCFRAQADIDGTIRILDTPQRLVIDGPDTLATMVFRIPATQERTWVADGELRDSKNRPAGRVQFSQVWNTRSELASLERELAQRVTSAEQRESTSFGSLVFWSVLSIIFLAWFYKSFAEKRPQAPNKPNALLDDPVQ
jgi:hypothetical protein